MAIVEFLNRFSDEKRAGIIASIAYKRGRCVKIVRGSNNTCSGLLRADADYGGGFQQIKNYRMMTCFIPRDF
jgi:hypothetical protein